MKNTLLMSPGEGGGTGIGGGLGGADVDKERHDQGGAVSPSAGSGGGPTGGDMTGETTAEGTRGNHDPVPAGLPTTGGSADAEGGATSDAATEANGNPTGGSTSPNSQLES